MQKKDSSYFVVAGFSLGLGLFSLFILAAGTVAGIFVEHSGITGFLNPAFATGAGAVACGIYYKKQVENKEKRALRMSVAGIITGALAIVLTIFIRLAVFIFFIPWLWGGR